MRPDKDLYFLTIANAVSLRSTCNRRAVGCVLVNKHHHILSTGYNGPASGQPSCDPCSRLGAKSGEELDRCISIHAEQNALLQCPDSMSIFTAYITISPCLTCVKLLMNTSCKNIVFIGDYSHPESANMWLSCDNCERTWTKREIGPDIQRLLDAQIRLRHMRP